MRIEHKEKGCLYNTIAFLVLAMLACTLLMFSCKPTQISGQAFDILGRLTEAKLKELLMYEGSMRKDSVSISIVVPRKHCRKVLGKKMNLFVTSLGEASLSKSDLYIKFAWEVQSDTSKVKLLFKKIKK